MIALDTNVLVRYLVDDEPIEQCERAAALVDEAVDAGRELFISNVVVCECVWVLESAYGVERSRVADILSRLLETRQVRFRDRRLVQKAVEAYETSAGDLADYLIQKVAVDEGADAVATFDRDLLGEDGFVEP